MGGVGQRVDELAERVDLVQAELQPDRFHVRVTSEAGVLEPHRVAVQDVDGSRLGERLRGGR